MQRILEKEIAMFDEGEVEEDKGKRNRNTQAVGAYIGLCVWLPAHIRPSVDLSAFISPYANICSPEKIKMKMTKGR